MKRGWERDCLLSSQCSDSSCLYNPKRCSHLWFGGEPKEKTWTEPEELVARRISGSSVAGANDKEKIFEEYDPLLKLYDCKWTRSDPFS